MSLAGALAGVLACDCQTRVLFSLHPKLRDVMKAFVIVQNANALLKTMFKLNVTYKNAGFGQVKIKMFQDRNLKVNTGKLILPNSVL